MSITVIIQNLSAFPEEQIRYMCGFGYLHLKVIFIGYFLFGYL